MATMKFFLATFHFVMIFLPVELIALSYSNSKKCLRIHQQTNHQPFVKVNRRNWLASVVGSAAALTTAPSYVAAAGAEVPKIEGIGGGADIGSILSSNVPDVVYPESLIGVWQCERVVTSVEGNADQAKIAWKALGGRDADFFDKRKTETYLTRYIHETDAVGEQVVVLDRGFELESRTSASVTLWDPATSPNVLGYQDPKDQPVELAIVERRTELPSDKGFGFNELVRITTKGLGVGGEIQRASRVQRRYRRAFDDQGNRLVEGIELVKTYRVLDGVAGVEMPTSTTKSQILMKRP